jgi:hypothetical protein
MGPGNLVKVTTPASGGGVVTTSYVVSEHNAERAVDVIRSKIAQLTDEVTAVSRVSEELLNALRVPPGGFKRADGQRS